MSYNLWLRRNLGLILDSRYCYCYDARMSIALQDILAELPAEGVSLEELTALANRVLESVALAVDDGRTTDRVDARTIRFYQTLAILPKPGYEGRRAIYQREHLVRVLAAKQLQAEGFTLAQIQASLPARTFDELASALFTLSIEPPTVAVPAAPPGALIALTLAPGVTVLIDPSLVPDSGALNRALTRTAQLHLQRHAGPVFRSQSPSHPTPGEQP